MAAGLFHLTRSPRLQPLLSATPPPPPPPAKLTRAALFSKEAYWSKINEEIEAHIRRAVPLHTPPVVHRPIAELVASAPRTMAPALCVAAFDLVGEDNSPAERAAVAALAAALHVLYAGSWAHEFLPHLLERRGPAVHNANIELLSGDAISPLGYEMIANCVSGDGENAGRVMRVVAEMSRSMGAQGYVQGQDIHVNWARGLTGHDHEPTNPNSWAEGARRVSRKKEGELYACGAACGAIIGGAGEAEVERLRRFGLCVGTIHGLLHGSGRDERAHAGTGSKEVIMDSVDALKASALMELQAFEVGRADAISSILDDSGCESCGR